MDIGKRVEESYVLKRTLTSSPGNRPEASPKRLSAVVKFWKRFGGKLIDKRPAGTAKALLYTAPASSVAKEPPKHI